MKRRGSIWFVVLLTALLSACASTVEPETAEVRVAAPEGKARIYFYRTGRNIFNCFSYFFNWFTYFSNFFNRFFKMFN